jgi:hypothetical protein
MHRTLRSMLRVAPASRQQGRIATSVDGGRRGALFVAAALDATGGDHVNHWLGQGMGSSASRTPETC